jgi:hypothetical protein
MVILPQSDGPVVININCIVQFCNQTNPNGPNNTRMQLITGEWIDIELLYDDVRKQIMNVCARNQHGT